MALVLDSPLRDEILTLSNQPMPVRLNKMSFDELEAMNHQIGQIIEEEFLETSLHERLLQLRANIVLTMWSS
jgi:hypothetical protein